MDGVRIGLAAKLLLTITLSLGIGWNKDSALAFDGSPELIGPRLRFNPPSFLEVSSLKVTLSPHLIRFSYTVSISSLLKLEIESG